MDSPDEFIQGIGNEVFYFMCLLMLVLLLVVSWYSTYVVEPIVQSVILVEERSIHTGGQGAPSIREVDVTEFLQASPTASASANENIDNGTEADDDVNNQTEAEEQGTFDNISDERISDSATTSIPSENRVTIRLKFLNDTQKDVEASLVENIGQFKRRNFTEEISNNKIVRLIFNGQVLGQDGNTLESYGLFDKCVVHCLVHQSSQSNTGRPQQRQQQQQHQQQQQPPDLDLSIYCIPLLGLILIMLWYLRLTYSAYFNIMSTLALIGLTSLYFLSVYGTHFHVNVAVRTGAAPMRQ